jgi:hypothetical protein
LIDRPTIDRPLQLIDLSSPAAKNTPAKIRPHCPGPDLLTSGLFLRLQLGLAVGLGGAGGLNFTAGQISISLDTLSHILPICIVWDLNDDQCEN